MPAKRRTRPLKKPSPPKSKGGADKQTLYRKEYDTIAERLVRLTGATVSEIAEILNVSVATIYNWQARHEGFRNALLMPLEIANRRVEVSAYNEAVGYFVEEEEIKIFDGKVLRLKKKVWQRPSPTMVIWWQKVKAGWMPADQLPPPSISDDGATTIDQSIKPETDRQFARRLLFLVAKAENDEEDTA